MLDFAAGLFDHLSIVRLISEAIYLKTNTNKKDSLWVFLSTGTGIYSTLGNEFCSEYKTLQQAS